MLIMVATSTWDKGTNFIRISKWFFSEIVEIGPFVMECELCVYRQEMEKPR